MVSAVQLCDADSGSILRPKGESYYHTVSHGFSQAWRDYVEAMPIIPGRGTLVGRTLLEGRVVHIPDVLQDEEYEWAKAQKVGGYRAMLGVPLVREGTLVGVINLTRLTPRPFTDKQIQLLSTFADQAVIAIENARLFEEVQARTARAGGVAAAADRDRGCAQGHQPLDLRPAAGARHARRIGG